MAQPWSFDRISKIAWERVSGNVQGRMWVPLCLAFWMGMSRHKVTSWLRALGDANWGWKQGFAIHLFCSTYCERTACPFVFQKSALYCLVFYRIRILLFGFMCHWYVVFETHFGVYVSFKECCSNCICRQQCLSPDCEQVGNRPIEAHSRKTLVDSAHDQVWANQDQAVGTTWNPTGLGTKTLSAGRHRMLATCWTCFWMVTRWENSNISEQPKPTGTNRPLRNLQRFIFQFFFDPARAAQHCKESCSTCLLEQHRYDARSRVSNMQRSCITAGLEPTSSSWVWFVLVRQDVSWFWWFLQVWSCMLSCGRLSAAWIYWMSQRFGPIVSAHTCCPPDKIQLPEFVSQSW